MILRVLNFVVIGLLVLAAAYVYRIKFDSTVQAERLAKIRSELRHERDTIAALRAKWGELDDPARIQGLAKRFLALRSIAPTQFDTFDNLPPRPPELVSPYSADPIGAAIKRLEQPDGVTGSIAAPDATGVDGVAAAEARTAVPQTAVPQTPEETGAADTQLPAAKSGRLDR
jgi:hypothetical protein